MRVLRLHCVSRRQISALHSDDGLHSIGIPRPYLATLGGIKIGRRET